MIKMYVSKNEDGQMLIAKPDDSNTSFVNLKDVVKIVFIQTQQGMAPYPCYFPNMMIKDVVKKDVLNKMDVIIDVREYVVIDEDDIVPDMLELYQIEMKKRDDVPQIKIVGSVPHGLKLVK